MRKIGPRRSVAAKNLSIALPNESKESIAHLVDATYEHLVWTGLELIILQREPKQALLWVEAENAELLDELYGKGAILMTPHVGSWELAGAWVAQRGCKVTVIARDPDDGEDRDLINGMRRRTGIMLLSRGGSMKPAISVLKRGEFLGILPDQHGGGEGISVPFFGIETSTSHGPAVFAYLTGRPIVPVLSRRLSPFRHKVKVCPPIEPGGYRSRDEAIFEMTRAVNKSVEQAILEAPGQWLAQHKRFKEMKY
ncbi:lipid A biosynthesis acyltransferase [Synergistales bacterium]|nr:lipid A biosynthesis acyltransferase [Synergistales bacterium]